VRVPLKNLNMDLSQPSSVCQIDKNMMLPALKLLSMVKFEAAKYSRDFYSYI